MDVMLPGRVLSDKLISFIGWLRQERGQDVSPYSGDAFDQELHQLEQTLNDVSTRPSSIVRRLNNSLEPITEQQRIIDLAG